MCHDGWVVHTSGPQLPTVEVAVLAKEFGRAKSRLDFSPPHRRRLLAEAMLLDTLAAVRPVAERVVVVSSEPFLAGRLAAALPSGDSRPVAVIPDPGSLDAAVIAADRWFATVRGDHGATLRIAMVADLPAITAGEFSAVVADAARHARSFVADAAGTGTTAVCATTASLLSRFGSGSAHRHRSAGLVELSGPWPGARRDVDLLADLAAAQELGVGRHTSAVIVESGPDTTAGPAPRREPCCR